MYATKTPFSMPASGSRSRRPCNLQAAARARLAENPVMCLILFAYAHHPDYRLVLAANRDEFYQRPTASLAFWKDYPDILAGRDLQQMGTWMGVTRRGRLAAVTNYREARPQHPDAPSRGALVTDFLTSDLPPGDYLAQIQAKSHRYNGFNLIVGDADSLYYYSNRGGRIQALAPGIYGLSNHLLDSPWPKIEQGKAELSGLLQDGQPVDAERVLQLLQHQNQVPDHLLPQTGVSLDWERVLSPIFITSPTYGTRCSSVLLMEKTGHLRFLETTWRPAQDYPHPVHTRRFKFQIEPQADRSAQA